MQTKQVDDVGEPTRERGKEQKVISKTHEAERVIIRNKPMTNAGLTCSHLSAEQMYKYL